MDEPSGFIQSGRFTVQFRHHVACQRAERTRVGHPRPADAKRLVMARVVLFNHTMHDIAENPTQSYDYLNGLNPRQREAVETTDGPVLVLSGAGTGKTKVLTTRIAHLLIQRKAFSGQILAVTFTNKAAREMTKRVEQIIGPAVAGLWIGTFHSIGAKILRRHAEVVGLQPNFLIVDDDDQMRIMKQLVAEHHLDEKKWPPRVFHALIQRWKDKGIFPQNADNTPGSDYCGGMSVALYRAYQKRLLALNACDFGDLLLHNLALFREHPDILREYGRRFKYILVDEYQDTNVAQYLWLRLLSMENRNICCVGDDDQSIYGWRGAEVDNILRFEKDFPGAAVIRLEQNYRSKGNILAAASALIAKNTGRLGKTLWTEDDAGDVIRVVSTYDDRDEALHIAQEIESLQRSGVALNDIAILVRAGFQTRSFEERFMTEAIPYRIIGGLRFYERQEIKDALAYLRLLIQPADDLALERIINVPKRGLGDAALNALRDYGRSHNASMYAAAEILIEEGAFKGKGKDALGYFLRLFREWRTLRGTLPDQELVNRILDDSGYRQMWKQENSPDAMGRLENLRELVAAIGEFENLEAFLEHVSLVTDTDNTENDDKVSLMSLHAAKGLEFSAVFLPGWEEGIFPHQRALEESGPAGLEEERRLAYVGITRARHTLTITHALSRRVYNQWQNNLPSRFLSEIPDEQVERTNRSGFGGGAWKSQIDAIFSEGYARTGSYAPSASNDSPMQRPAPKPESKFTLGGKVRHKSFGVGKVVAINGDRVDVVFESAGIKKVLEDFLEKA